MTRSEPSAVLPSLGRKPPDPAGRTPAPRSPGPGTRPAPGARCLLLPLGRRPRLPPNPLRSQQPRRLTRKREPAIIVAPAMRLQEAGAVLLLAEIPMAEPGARRAPGARGPPAAGISGCFCPAPHPPPPPEPGAHLPPTPHVHCGSRTARQTKEAAREAPGALSTCPAARLPGRGEAAAAATRASPCSPPTAAAENQGGGLGARERRNNFP